MREEHMSIKLVCLTALLAIASLFLVAGADAAPKPQSCGGIAGIACGDGSFCQFPAGKCGAVDMLGVCTKIPSVCTRIFRPVCGCDGKTYPNDCERQVAKVSKKANGKCKVPY
jgi:Kazal-type serine protease inhibitor domain